MLRGGKSGPALVPGKPAVSLLLKKIRAGEMPPLRFAWVLVRFAAGQVAMVVRSFGVHLRKAAAPPKAVVFDRTPKKGA